MIEAKVTYTLERARHFYLIENVPARISPETGEQFFSPETVQRLQSFIFQDAQPKKVIQTPVFEFQFIKQNHKTHEAGALQNASRSRGEGPESREAKSFFNHGWEGLTQPSTGAGVR